MSKIRRSFRVGDKIRELVANTLIRTSDPRFNLITITGVQMSNDSKEATVYWTCHNGKEKNIESITQAFDGATPMFRKTIAAGLGMRFAPEIQFLYDDTLERVNKLEEIFAKVRGE